LRRGYHSFATNVLHSPKLNVGDRSALKTTIDKWSLLALTRFLLALIVAISDLRGFVPLGWLSWVPLLGPFEAMLGFLLISGYSIGSSYGREPNGFLYRRAWRIYPAYLGSIVLTCFALPGPLDIPFAATLLQNTLFTNQITTHTSFVEPSWTLALMVWLYCLTPWLWKLKTEHLRLAMYLSFAAFCGYEVCRSAFDLPYYTGLAYGVNLAFLSFAWLAGFLLAREPSLALRTIRDCSLIFLGYIVLAMAIQTGHRWKHGELHEIWSDLNDFTWRASTLWMLIELFKAIARGETGPAQSGTMRVLGGISYPLYVVHVAVFTIAARFSSSGAVLMLAATLTALIFYYCVDLRPNRQPSAALQEAPHS
jgi:peptidoglycan/LPS O-acetylase OafA/YrhL